MASRSSPLDVGLNVRAECAGLIVRAMWLAVCFCLRWYLFYQNFKTQRVTSLIYVGLKLAVDLDNNTRPINKMGQ